MTNKQIEILKTLGFNEIVTEKVISLLETKTTKTAQNVLKRINLIKSEKQYEIYISDTHFTIKSDFLVTQEEIKQIKQVLKTNYKRLSIALDENNLWIEWVTEENKRYK